MSKIIVSADLPQGTISRHIYGHFAEHLGRCIYEGLWVGDGSGIKNERGIRTDVVEALKRLAIPNLRWPGGCFADEYHWTDGIGPRTERPTMVNSHWGKVTESNHFGTHEFMDLCGQLGCEPYICGNVGSGTVREMADWVEYLTFSGESRMADLRRKNGRKDPWGIRYWGVGNENWGCGGNMRPEYYADLYRRYGTYCRSYGADPLYKIACGPRQDDYRWTEVLMREAGRFMDGLSLHYYTSERQPDGSRIGSATDFDEGDWFTFLRKGLYMEELVTRHSAIMDQYDPQKRVGLIVDEWGTWYAAEPGTNPRFLYQQNSLRDALVAATTLDIFNRHCDRVRMANLAQTVNVLQAVILTDGARMLLTPTYHVFEMYKVHQDAVLLPAHVEREEYRWKDSAIPAVSASASLDGKDKIHLTLSNADPHRVIPMEVELRGRSIRSARGRLLTGRSINSHNTFDKPDEVKPVELEGISIRGERLSFSLPAMSVVAIEAE